MASNENTHQESVQREAILRVRRNPFRIESSRRVSCKDLGNGDCEGWLWKKSEKPGFASKDWKKFWFTLKERSLYYYKHKDDDMAQGIFKMPAFIVSPVGDKDSLRKYAFKACHPKYGTSLFASERKEDMVKWMNMLQIACLPDVNPTQLSPIDSAVEDFSGSESEDESATEPGSILQLPDNQTDSTPLIKSSFDNSEIDFFNLGRNRTSGLIEMTIRPDLKISFQRSIKGKSSHVNLRRHLSSLQRTLKDKESQLSILNEFLSSSWPITSESLNEFQTIAFIAEILSASNNDDVSHDSFEV